MRQDLVLPPWGRTWIMKSIVLWLVVLGGFSPKKILEMLVSSSRFWSSLGDRSNHTNFDTILQPIKAIFPCAGTSSRESQGGSWPPWPPPLGSATADIGCLIEHQVANIVNLNAICAITNCHSIYYSIILTFNGNYQKIKIFINWFLNITEAIFENLRAEGYMQACVICFIESCRIQRYIILFLNPETLGFQKNTIRICPYDWYQLAKFWLLADRQITLLCDLPDQVNTLLCDIPDQVITLLCDIPDQVQVTKYNNEDRWQMTSVILCLTSVQLNIDVTIICDLQNIDTGIGGCFLFIQDWEGKLYLLYLS